MINKVYGGVDTASLPSNCHIIEVHSEGFGYSIVHKHNGKLIYTAAYLDSNQALRVASGIGASKEKGGEKAFVLINPHR